MAQGSQIASAFRLLQTGDAVGALAQAEALIAKEPRSGRAHLVAGMALRALGRMEAARTAFEHAASLDASDFAAAYEWGLIRAARRDADGALAEFERASRLRPAFAPAAYAAGMERFRRREWREAAEHFQAAQEADPRNIDAALAGAQALHLMGRADEADRLFRKTLDRAPGNAAALRAYGQFLVTRGQFEQAAERFAACVKASPEDDDAQMFLAQARLVTARLREGWLAYQHRESRRQHITARQAAGAKYEPPAPGSQPPALRIVAEQGLGDILFFLRYAVPLARSGTRLTFTGDARLHSLLERTGLFAGMDTDPSPSAIPEVLTGDLPVLVPGDYPPPLSLMAQPERVEKWRALLDSQGPHPWTGITWRAGTPKDVLAHGLEKAVPVEALLRRLKKGHGTVVALQRGPRPGEIEAASASLGTPVYDASRMNDDLEDALALLAVLDRHVGVSNTNMHLAAGLGKTAEVLVPFPPEWRWGFTGEHSPWYPGFRVLRQSAGGDWLGALAPL